MRVLKVSDKHGEALYDANTDEALSRACLKVLRERWNEGWYERPDDLERPHTDEVIASLKEGTAARGYAVHENERWESRSRARDEAVQWFDSVEQLLGMPEEEAVERTSKLWTGRLSLTLGPYEDFPTAYVALAWRSKQGHEYERVELVETIKVTDNDEGDGMDIYVGMKREHLVRELRRMADEAAAMPADSTNVDVTLYGESNVQGGGDVTLHFSNDDMERDEVAADAVFVDVTE